MGAEQPDETVTFGATPGLFGPTPGPFGPTPGSSEPWPGRPLRVGEAEAVCDRPSFCPATALFSPASALRTQPVINNPTMHEDGSYLKQLLLNYLGQSQNTIQEAE